MGEGIVLSHAHATCPVDGCETDYHQIDTTRERAVQVVTDAMEAHIAAQHPDFELPGYPNGESK